MQVGGETTVILSVGRNATKPGYSPGMWKTTRFEPPK